jgi:hypothetical protein
MFLDFTIIVSSTITLADLGNRVYTAGTYDIGQEFHIEDIRYSSSLAAAIFAGNVTATDSLGQTITAQGTLSLTEGLLNKAGHAQTSDALPQGATNLYYDDTLVGNFINIGPSSAPYLNFNSSTGQLDITALAITDVSVDNVYTSIAAFVAGAYTTGTYQESDTVILTAATGGTQIWINNGLNTLTVSDWTQIEAPNLTDAYIRGLFSVDPSSPLTYNPTTGVFNSLYDGISIKQNSAGELYVDAALIPNGTLANQTLHWTGTTWQETSTIETDGNLNSNLSILTSATIINRTDSNPITLINASIGTNNFVQVTTTGIELHSEDTGGGFTNTVIVGFDKTSFLNGISIGNITGLPVDGDIRYNGTNFQGYKASAWYNLDAQGTTYIAGEGISIPSDDSINVLYDNVTIGINDPLTNQLYVKDLGIDTAQLAADSVDDTKIDWGTGANQVNAADLPVISYTWSSIATPSDTQDALQKLDASITANVLTEGNGISISTGNVISVELYTPGALSFNGTGLTVNVDDSSIEIAAGPNQLQVKADGIKDTMIDFGTGAGQVNAADVPVLTSTFLTIDQPTDVQDAIEKLDAEISGRFSWHLGASSNNANVTNRFIEREGSTRTNQSPYVLWYACTLEAISLSSNAAATWTAEIYKNGTSVATLASGGARYAQTTGVNVSFAAGDKVSMYVTGTGINRPSIDALFSRNPA